MITVIIPTYKNKEDLVKNLKHNMLFLSGCETIVINDDPTESLKKDFRVFPDIILIENSTNLGFAGTVEKGIKQAKGTYILLLNDDVLINDASFTKAATTLQNGKTIFAVGFAQKEKDGSIVGKNCLYWKNGFFHHKKASNTNPGINGWAEGGACMINKQLYEKVGGFDSLYSPFYWEDIDLSYRAWKTGYQVLFDPNIIVAHYHGSTIHKQFKREKINIIAYRNQFIFIWKNIKDSRLLLFHIGRLMYSLPIMLFKDISYVVGFLKALLQLPNILAKRKEYLLSDTEILNKFK